LKYIVDEVYRNRSENGRKNWCWTGEERRMASQIRSERKVQVYILRWVRLVDIGLLAIFHYKYVWVVARFISRFSQRSSVISRFFRYLKPGMANLLLVNLLLSSFNNKRRFWFWRQFFFYLLLFIYIYWLIILNIWIVVTKFVINLH
jgi:hypothetical protein